MAAVCFKNCGVVEAAAPHVQEAATLLQRRGNDRSIPRRGNDRLIQFPGGAIIVQFPGGAMIVQFPGGALIVSNLPPWMLKGVLVFTGGRQH